MCHYITAVLPATANHSAVEALFHLGQRKLDAQKNASISSQLRPGECYYVTTRGNCDCGTPLGELARAESGSEAFDPDAQGKKLRRKGWSEARISRWLKQKEDQLASAAQTLPAGGSLGTEAWRALITDVLRSGNTPYVCLLLHWYSGPVSGRIQLSGREVIDHQELTSERLARMREDVLYEFRASPRRRARESGKTPAAGCDSNSTRTAGPPIPTG